MTFIPRAHWLEITGPSFEKCLKMLQNLPNIARFEIRLGRLGPGGGHRNGPHVTMFGDRLVLIEYLLPGQADQIQSGIEKHEALLGTFQYRSGYGSYTFVKGAEVMT